MPQLVAEGSSTTMHAWLAGVRHPRQWGGGATEAELATASGSAGALALVAVVEHWMYVGELEDADKRSAGQCAAVQFVANSVLVWAARGFRSSYWQDTT